MSLGWRIVGWFGWASGVDSKPNFWVPDNFDSNGAIDQAETSISKHDYSFESLPVEMKKRIVAVVNAKEFQSWYSSNTHHLLYVHCGHTPGTAYTKSESAFLCADLGRSKLIVSQAEPIILSYFCSQHASRKAGASTHGVDLLGSLISQLLGHVDPDKSWPNMINGAAGPDWFMMEAIERQFCDYVAIFFNLLKAVPKGTPVLCLIEDINTHENPNPDVEERTSLQAVIGPLEDLTSDPDVNEDIGCVLKVLFVCRTTTTQCVREFKTKEAKQRILEIPKVLESQEPMIRTNAQWRSLMESFGFVR